MPRNLVGSQDVHKEDEPSEEELLAANLPSEPITFRWRYSNKNIQLYERHLRSLKEYGIGSALQAWMRSRLEWVSDNKLSELPDGVVVIDVDPSGDVDIDLQEQTPSPHISKKDLHFHDDKLVSCDYAGSIWAKREEQVFHFPTQLKGACETLARDLMKTLHYDVIDEELTKSVIDAADELFFINDEFGIIPCEGSSGELISKMQTCFDKLWSN